MGLFADAAKATHKGYSLIDALDMLRANDVKYGEFERSEAGALVQARAVRRERIRLEEEADREAAQQKAMGRTARNTKQLSEAADVLLSARSRTLRGIGS